MCAGDNNDVAIPTFVGWPILSIEGWHVDFMTRISSARAEITEAVMRVARY